jgi:hypothetical protein
VTLSPSWAATFSKPATAPNSLSPSTTVLSPYVTHGCLSARTFYYEVLKAQQKHKVRASGKHERSGEASRSEGGWRASNEARTPPTSSFPHPRAKTGAMGGACNKVLLPLPPSRTLAPLPPPSSPP